jgi:hypothetical protein
MRGTRILNDARALRYRYALVLCGLILAGMFSYYFALNHTRRHLYDPNAEEFSLESACAGTAATPFRYRVLVIWIIDGVLWMLPRSAGVSSPLEVMLPMEAAATFALFVALWFWLKAWPLHVYGRVLGILLSANAMIVTYLVPTKLSHFYWYDIPSVLFFTIALLAIRQNRVLLFYPLFVAATLNKETSCFLSVAFLLLQWRHGRTRAVCHVAVQAVLWTGVKVALCYAAGQGAASTFWWALPRNLQALGSLTSYDLKLLASTLGFLPIVTLVSWRSARDRDARLLAWLTVPFVSCMLMVGWVEEIRIYAELLPVLLPVSVLGIQGALDHMVARAARRHQSRRS